MAAVYRRHAGFRTSKCNLDFSMQALLECHSRESKGTSCSNKNGYFIGKHWKDLMVTSWREGIEAGDVFKAEFYSPLNNWWIIPALESVIAKPWFPYDKNIYTRTKDGKLINGTNKDVIKAIETVKEVRLLEEKIKTQTGE